MSRTLRGPAVCTGIGIHTGNPVVVRLIPREDPGVIFVRSDLGGAPSVVADRRDLAPSGRCTRLCNGDAVVMTVEHLLAACWALDVSGLIVEIDSEELPVGDGSALMWCDAFGASGLRNREGDPTPMAQARAITVTRGEASISIEPATEWRVEYRGVFFGGREQSATWQRQTDFRREIAPARTFCRLSEALYLRKSGLIAGGTIDNALLWVDGPFSASVTAVAALGLRNMIVTEEDLPAPQCLRFADEFARHKLLDLMGDLALAGDIGPCTVKAHMSGHELNHELLHAL